MQQRRPRGKASGKDTPHKQQPPVSSAGHSATVGTTGHAEQVSNAQLEPVNPWKHIGVWFLGVVVGSLAPLLWNYISSNKAPGPGIYQVFGKGDLYLISVVLLLAGITEIILLIKRIEQDFTVALLIVGGILIVIFDIGKYSNASTLYGNVSAPPNSVTYWSLAAYIVSTIHSSICVWLAAGVR